MDGAKKYCLYKYVLNGEIIYIGKTKHLGKRVVQHKYEEKFKPYADAEVFYFECMTAADLACFEMILINKYKPILNKHSVFDGDLSIEINVPSFLPYVKEPTQRELAKKQKQDKVNQRHGIVLKLLSIVQNMDISIQTEECFRHTINLYKSEGSNLNCTFIQNAIDFIYGKRIFVVSANNCGIFVSPDKELNTMSILHGIEIMPTESVKQLHSMFYYNLRTIVDYPENENWLAWRMVEPFIDKYIIKEDNL